MLELFLFNREEFLLSRDGAKRTTITHYSEKDNKLTALFHFYTLENEGISPWRAPFGSIEFSEKLTTTELLCFIEEIDNSALRQGLSSMKVISYPECYAPVRSTLLTHALLQKGYTIINADITYYIPVDNTPLINKVHRTRKQRLKRAVAAGLVVQEDTNYSIDNLYSLISNSRKRKGYPVTMTKEGLEHVLKTFPQFYKIFSIYDGNILVATAIVIIISSKVAYTFYVADNSSYRHLSPVALLYQKIYDYCFSKNITILDMGIGTDQGTINQSLTQFKTHMGGTPSLKLTFHKKY